MFEAVILGIVQGITEWLPISSEGVLFLIKTNFFGFKDGITVLMKNVFFLHLGTFFAVLVYFREDIWNLIKTFFNYRKAQQEQKKILKFIIFTTLVSAAIGIFVLLTFMSLESQISFTAKAVNIIIGVLLLITAFFQIKAKKSGHKSPKDLTNTDNVLLGFMQGISALPGLSRSGLTISSLLLRNFDETAALRLSFLMSLPVVLAGGIIFNINNFSFSISSFLGLLFSFIFGILTIDLLLRLARKVNFGWFVLVFGVLVILAVFI